MNVSTVFHDFTQEVQNKKTSCLLGKKANCTPALMRIVIKTGVQLWQGRLSAARKVSALFPRHYQDGNARRGNPFPNCRSTSPWPIRKSPTPNGVGLFLKSVTYFDTKRTPRQTFR